MWRGRAQARAPSLMKTQLHARAAPAALLVLAPLARAQSGFSFDHDQAPKDAIIPAVVPVIFASVAPSDAPLIPGFLRDRAGAHAADEHHDRL